MGERALVKHSKTCKVTGRGSATTRVSNDDEFDFYGTIVDYRKGLAWTQDPKNAAKQAAVGSAAWLIRKGYTQGRRLLGVDRRCVGCRKYPNKCGCSGISWTKRRR